MRWQQEGKWQEEKNRDAAAESGCGERGKCEWSGWRQVANICTRPNGIMFNHRIDKPVLWRWQIKLVCLWLNSLEFKITFSHFRILSYSIYLYVCSCTLKLFSVCCSLTSLCFWEASRPFGTGEKNMLIREKGRRRRSEPISTEETFRLQCEFCMNFAWCHHRFALNHPSPSKAQGNEKNCGSEFFLVICF